jgi:molecular chaperone GrpE
VSWVSPYPNPSDDPDMQQPNTPPEAPPVSDVPIVSQEAAADHVPEPPPADPAPDVDALLRKAEEEVAGLKDAWLRARAELENVRKVAAADVAKAHRYAAEKFASDLLPVKDALEQTLAAANASPEQLRAGVELTLKQLRSAFERAHVAEVDPAGQKFDPHRHQAMQMVDADLPPNTVVQVFQKGYVLHDRVLRPAMVTVAKGG